MDEPSPVGPRRSGGDVWFVVVLLALAALAAILWLNDPSHSPVEDSRVPWPDPKPAKP